MTGARSLVIATLLIICNSALGADDKPQPVAVPGNCALAVHAAVTDYLGDKLDRADFFRAVVHVVCESRADVYAVTFLSPPGWRGGGAEFELDRATFQVVRRQYWR